MAIYRSDEKENVRESSLANEIADSYLNKLATMQDSVYEGISAEQYMKARNVLNSKTAFQDMVDNLARRAGLKQYIQLINDEVNGIQSTAKDSERLESLLEIQEVKDEIDKALENNKFDSYVNLLNELSKEIKGNDKIPEYLKNVFGDKKLKEYVSKHILAKDKEKEDYSIKLNPKKNTIESTDDKNKPYFSFDSTDDQHK